MQSTGPVDGNIALAAVEPRSAFHGSACTDTAELEQSIKDWAVVSHVVLALLFDEHVHVVRCNLV
jgi:hypothetical protein